MKIDVRGLNRRYALWIVWTFRIVVGCVFVMSGFVKSVDIWGFIYKVEEYLAVWHMPVSRELVLAGTTLLSGTEYVLGGLLLMGCYRRVAPWLLGAMMAFMLPLSAYIAVADPVSDCGCFGDFWVISNTATFVKNIFLTLAILYLAFFNKRVKGLFSPYAQWMPGAVLTLFILVVTVAGYTVQPLLDFRRFTEGVSLVEDEDDSETENAVYEFIYERDGERHGFTVDALPDSTWTFVERRLVSGSENVKDGFVVLDGDTDVTADYISDSGEQLLVVSPEPQRMGHVYDLTIERLATAVNARGGSLLLILAGDDGLVSHWGEMSDAEYDILKAEPTLIKELARGNGALVALNDGRVQWKRTLTSLPANDDWMSDPLTELRPNLGRALIFITVAQLVLLLAAFILDRFFSFIFKKSPDEKVPAKE